MKGLTLKEFENSIRTVPCADPACKKEHDYAVGCDLCTHGATYVTKNPGESFITVRCWTCRVLIARVEIARVKFESVK